MRPTGVPHVGRSIRQLVRQSLGKGPPEAIRQFADTGVPNAALTRYLEDEFPANAAKALSLLSDVDSGYWHVSMEDTV